MMKNDFEILVTAVIVAFLLALANLNSVSKGVDSLYSDLESYRQTENYKAYIAFKDSEAAFWSDLKGTKSSSGEITDILNVAPTQKSSNQQELTQTPAENKKITTPVKVLLVGDSMMLVGFGPALENSLLKYNGVSVVREGAYSTGLNRIDYYDWFTKTDELIALHKPDILVVMFGGNDGQGIIDKNKKSYTFGAEGWAEVYRERVNVYLTRTSSKVKKIYWVGHPITGNDDFLNKFLAMNPIYQSECAKFPNAVFVDSWKRFAVNGEFRQSIPDDNGLWQIAKQSDGVHVTDFGGRILSGLVINEVLKDVELK